jgi:hypothetical protein
VLTEQTGEFLYRQCLMDFCVPAEFANLTKELLYVAGRMVGVDDFPLAIAETRPRMRDSAPEKSLATLAFCGIT